MRPSSPVPKLKPKPTRAARDKLIEAAMELFGEYGFEGASVRDIAKKAGQNLGSISYYFGDKKGLYTAVAEEIASRMRGKLGGLLQEIETALDGGRLSQAEHIDCMKRLANGVVAALVQQSRHSRGISQIFAREQFAPTHVLRILYEQVHAPLQNTYCRLLGSYLGKPSMSEEIIIRAYTLFGSAMIFRLAREMVLLRTGWKTFGEREIRLIAGMVTENIELVLSGLQANSDESGGFEKKS